MQLLSLRTARRRLLAELTTGCVESSSMPWRWRFAHGLSQLHTTSPSQAAWHPQWPPIWRRMLSRLDVRELYERSKHGKSNRWDKIGEIVKICFVEVTRLGELLARHKAVHAFVAQKIEANVDMQLQMDPIIQRLLELRRYLILCSFRQLPVLFRFKVIPCTAPVHYRCRVGSPTPSTGSCQEPSPSATAISIG